MGRRLAKREPTDCERSESKRPPKLRREVKASIGMLMRAMVSREWRVRERKLAVVVEEEEEEKEEEEEGEAYLFLWWGG